MRQLCRGCRREEIVQPSQPVIINMKIFILCVTGIFLVFAPCYGGSRRLTSKQKIAFAASKTVFIDRKSITDQSPVPTVEKSGRTIVNKEPADLVIYIERHEKPFWGNYVSPKLGSIHIISGSRWWGKVKFSAPGVESWEQKFSGTVGGGPIIDTGGRIPPPLSGKTANDTLRFMLDNIGHDATSQ